MRPSIGKSLAAAALATTLLATAACSGGGDTEEEPTGPVELSFWSWAPGIEKTVDLWNSQNPEIKVVLSKQAGGADIVTKLLTAAKAGNPPDLAQVEYQSLPTLVSNDVLADIAEQTKDVKDKFPAGAWQQVTLGTEPSTRSRRTPGR